MFLWFVVQTAENVMYIKQTLHKQLLQFDMKVVLDGFQTLSSFFIQGKRHNTLFKK